MVRVTIVETERFCACALGTQVEEVVRRFPAVLVPVLVKAATGAAASDFLRTEAFRLTSDVLQRYRLFSHVQYIVFFLCFCGSLVEGCQAVLLAFDFLLLCRAAERQGVKNFFFSRGLILLGCWFE